MTAPDQTNAEVSDERLREIEQAILLLRPAGNIAYHMKQGIVSPNAGGAPYEFSRINDAVNAAIKLLSSARRSVTTQASEGAEIWERCAGMAHHYAELCEEAGKGDAAEELYVLEHDIRHEASKASPSKRVERLEAALRAMLQHTGVRDAAAEDKDEEDHLAERLARQALGDRS